MGSQFDIFESPLLASSTQRHESKWTDISEAKITHTMFGKARVRTSGEQQKIRRAWLLTLLAVTILAAAAWEWSMAPQKTEAQPDMTLSALSIPEQSAAAPAESVAHSAVHAVGHRVQHVAQKAQTAMPQTITPSAPNGAGAAAAPSGKEAAPAQSTAALNQAATTQP